MIFPFILLLLINGDPLPWAGFQTREDCEQVRKHLKPAPGVTTSCNQTVRT